MAFMRRRRFIGILIFTAVLGACGKAAKLAAIPPGKTVLAFGDSVTHGTGAGAGEDWPSLLAAQTGWRVENAGIPGDTAEAGKQRIQALLDAHRPALVIIEIGGNDFLRRRSQKLVKEDLREIVRAARKAGAEVVLVAVPELSLLGLVARKPSDGPIYRELGEEEKIPVISDVFSDILASPELCADQIHPNAKGYQQMASGIQAELRKIGLAAG
jgi:acyl-CoA hydrolase